MPLLVLTKEVQTFERALVNYYIRELVNKYGASKVDRVGSAESCTTGQGDRSLGS